MLISVLLDKISKAGACRTWTAGSGGSQTVFELFIMQGSPSEGSGCWSTLRKAPGAELGMNIPMYEAHTHEAPPQTWVTWLVEQCLCMDGCRKQIQEERKSLTAPGRGNMGVSQETIPGRCPCRAGTRGLSLMRFSWRGLLAIFWQGLPEQLIRWEAVDFLPCPEANVCVWAYLGPEEAELGWDCWWEYRTGSSGHTTATALTAFFRIGFKKNPRSGPPPKIWSGVFIFRKYCAWRGIVEVSFLFQLVTFWDKQSSCLPAFLCHHQ